MQTRACGLKPRPHSCAVADGLHATPCGVNGNSAFRRFSKISTTESNERGSL
nr:MAG TPA: hypothetical protein [Caudoviricetes sp.]